MDTKVQNNKYQFSGNTMLPKATSYRMYALVAGKLIFIVLDAL
jgi:hypothetical protein